MEHLAADHNQKKPNEARQTDGSYVPLKRLREDKADDGWCQVVTAVKPDAPRLGQWPTLPPPAMRARSVGVVATVTLAASGKTDIRSAISLRRIAACCCQRRR